MMQLDELLSVSEDMDTGDNNSKEAENNNDTTTRKHQKFLVFAHHLIVLDALQELFDSKVCCCLFLSNIRSFILFARS